MATETPVLPKETAIDAAPTSAVMVDVSRAVKDRLTALIPSSTPPPMATSPSIYDLTSAPIIFRARTPEPATATPVPPLAARATEPARIMAPTVWLALDERITSRSASTLESLM